MEHRRRAPRRMRAAGAAVAAGHLVLGAIAWLALDVPGSMLFFGPCAALSLALALVVAPLLRPPPPRRDGPPGGGEEPPPPPWWPEFDRQFREWAARERSRA
jgi:hypothetical protein